MLVRHLVSRPIHLRRCWTSVAHDGSWIADHSGNQTQHGHAGGHVPRVCTAHGSQPRAPSRATCMPPRTRPPPSRRASRPHIGTHVRYTPRSNARRARSAPFVSRLALSLRILRMPWIQFAHTGGAPRWGGGRRWHTALSQSRHRMLTISARVGSHTLPGLPHPT